MITKQLLDLNRLFYAEHGRDFSATRERLQTGVLRVIESLRGDEFNSGFGLRQWRIGADFVAARPSGFVSRTRLQPAAPQ